MTRFVTLFHAPNSRSTGARILAEELQAEHDLHILDLRAGQQREPGYLAVNPMGKVPALLHDGVLVTEQAAVYLYLAELYPERGLVPPVGDPLRGSFLRWMVFYGSCFEPALTDRALKRADCDPSWSPYGDFDSVVHLIEQQLQDGRTWLLGGTADSGRLPVGAFACQHAGLPDDAGDADGGGLRRTVEVAPSGPARAGAGCRAGNAVDCYAGRRLLKKALSVSRPRPLR